MKIKLTVNQWKTFALGFWNQLWSERSLHPVPGTEDSDRTRGNRHKLKHMKFHPNKRKHFFTVRVLQCWYRLAREVWKFPSVETLRTPLAMTQDNLLQLTLLESRALGWIISGGPFPP